MQRLIFSIGLLYTFQTQYMNVFLDKFVEKTFEKSGKALDLGAGKFDDIAYLRRKRWKCGGVDKSIGVDLERIYLSQRRPFDLVFSNYVMHKLKNKKQLVETAYHNLRRGGWLFIHTFDASDRISSSTITRRMIRAWFKDVGFKHITTRVFKYYDNEPDHWHWHKILEAIAQK